MIYQVRSLIHAALNGEVQVIAHQTNCHGRMMSGIAPLIADAFAPVVRSADATAMAFGENTLGNFSKAIAFNEHGGTLTVFNLYGQGDFGYDGEQYTDYAALRTAMQAMSDSLPAGTRIGLPKLGAGLGGGDWILIEKIIEEILVDHDVIIYVLSFDEIPEHRLT